MAYFSIEKVVKIGSKLGPGKSLKIKYEPVHEISNNVVCAMWYVQPAKAQISLRICTVWSEPLLVALIFYEC